MKLIIFSFLGILIYTELHAQNAILNPICDHLPLEYSVKSHINCPAKFPANALHKIFEKNFPEVFFQKITHDDGEGYTVFGTADHSFYLKTTRDNKVIGLQQGSDKSDCHYNYKVETGKNGLRYCNADAPKNAGISCLKIHATDPIRNPKNQRVSCDAFLEAMLGCSKDADATEKCKTGIYAFMGNDNTKPIPNIAAKPMPDTEAGIADPEFCGEPDMPPCKDDTPSKHGSKGGSK
jgi:hypothetical protein